MTTDTRMIPVDQLYLHPYNPRQETTDADTEAMAASIETCGLIQNLSGYADPEKPDRIGIVAGGRRMRALQLLSDRDGGDPIEVPVRVTDDHFTARAWAGAENASHKPPHPAEEIRAYSAMGAQGNSPGMIARAFAVTETHVKRRLKLAMLPEAALTALHENRITLDAARALTLADSPEIACEVLDRIDGKDIDAMRIKQMLTPDAVPSTDRRARFVGLDTYRAEGGSMTEDLFADESYLHDIDLLNRLFRAKLEVKAEEVRETEGWQTVTPVENSWVGYEQTDKFARLWPTQVDLPEADAEELEQLEEIGLDGLTEEGLARRKELRDRERGDYTDEDRATGTVFVYVPHSGHLSIERAYGPKASRRGASDTVETSGGGQKPRMPQNCAEDLQRVQLLARQTALLGKTELLLDVLGWQIEHAAPGYHNPLGVSLSYPPITPDKDTNTHIDARLSAPTGAGDFSARFSIDALEAFQAKGKKHRNAVIAAGLARSLSPETTSAAGAALASLAAPDIRKIWTPDADNFFSRIRADLLDAIWADLLDLDEDDERRAEFARLKRKEKAAELETLFLDASVQEAHGLSRAQVARIDAWLPEELEG